VIGFQNRYRQPGVGAPLAAATQVMDPNAPLRDFVGPKVRVPVTAVLRLPNPREQVAGDRLTGQLDLHTATEEERTTINGEIVPLEQEPTVALGLTLTQARPWAQEISMFFGHLLQTDTAPRFGGVQPHHRGRIPVVFVHGTASNVSVWANTFNDLESDPVIRNHFEFFFFRYDSGQPIIYSGMLLRRALTEAERAFQSDGPDPCADAMVVIGHSQGGLLTKLTAIDSGDLFWRNVSDAPIEDAGLSDETRKLLQEAMFVKPLPFVRRVVFIATPQRGSYLAGPAIVRRLAQRLVALPMTVARIGPELLGADKVRRVTKMERLPTSIDNMSPGHPFIVTIAKIPVASDIAAHSIIGVVGDGPVEKGADGVVKYASAHIDGVESELVVPYPHSMQSKPEVVGEVQRILHHHLEVNGCMEGGIQ
jgi:pimeloyl-ACP methyl ester carboxylesterase